MGCQSSDYSEVVAEQLGTNYPAVLYPPEIRKAIYTTNAIESLNMSLRKVTRNRGHFPNDEAMFKFFIWPKKHCKEMDNSNQRLEVSTESIQHHI